MGKGIEILKELDFPHSLGLLYSAFTYYLGFAVNSGEYKLMGLAPYGNRTSADLELYTRIIRNQLVDIKDDGSIWLNQDFFSYAVGLAMVDDERWEKLFGFPRRLPEGKIEQRHCDLALAIQGVTEDVVIRMAREAKRLTEMDALCIAGGVGLNCVANGKLLKAGIFDKLFIQPAAGDAGGALGAALAAYHIYFGGKRVPHDGMDGMQGAYLGPDFSDKEIELTARRYKAIFSKFNDFQALIDKVADLIAKGSVIGWFQGRMEFGPRALGNRSILGDARNLEMQRKLNLKIKYREGFRPFAPSVLCEDVSQYFDLATLSPYMLLVGAVVKERQEVVPDGYDELPMMERLYVHRSDVQAITHVDMSARIQTVHRETNRRFWELINRFKEKTGYGVIVNTSFNVRGEPIVCNPGDAYRCFMRTEMDYLVMGDYLFKKTEQPNWHEKANWKEEFKLD